jgi:hypothetical protein
MTYFPLDEIRKRVASWDNYESIYSISAIEVVQGLLDRVQIMSAMCPEDPCLVDEEDIKEQTERLDRERARK